MKQSTKKGKYSHPHKIDGRYDDEFVLKLCTDFHFTSLNLEQLSEKYDLLLTSVRPLSNRFSPEEILAIKKSKKKQFVLMIDEQFYEAATEALSVYKIPFDNLNDATVSLEYKSKL